MKNIINDTLATMSREHLTATAKALGLPVGKSKGNTVTNITKAINDKTARFTVEFTIRSNANPDATVYPPAIYRAKLRTSKPNKVLVAPAV
mgnify:CR=1 FL=1